MCFRGVNKFPSSPSVRNLLLLPPVNFGSLDDNLDSQGAEWNSGLNLFGPFHTKVALQLGLQQQDGELREH